MSDEFIEIGYGEALQFGVSQGVYYKDKKQIVESLRQQLAEATDQIAAAVAACKVKDEALRDCAFDESGYCINPDAEEALAFMPSISEWKTRWQKEIAELRQQLAIVTKKLEMAEACLAGDGALITGLKDGLAERDELREQLDMFKSAVEHVTEDGCTRRSVVAMPEGWAMVHKDRLHDLELAEEQLAATDGLSGHIMCEKEPVVWMQSDHLSKFIHHACGAQAALVRCSDHQLMPDFQPLYRARSTK